MVRCWPAAAVSAGAALVLGGLAWETALLEPGSTWLAGVLGAAATVLPLWLCRRLWRQSHRQAALEQQVREQARRLQQLGRDEELLRRAEQVAQLGSFDWNPDTGELHWSEQHFRLWGHAPGALVPDYATFRASIHPDDLGPLEARLQHALHTGSGYEFNHRVVWTDGTVREVLARGDVTRDATGRAVRMVGTVQDVTRRRAAEQRLQLHEFVLNTITEPVSVVDEHLRYLLVNHAWSRATGLRAEDVIGRRPEPLLQRVASAERDAALQRCMDSGEPTVMLAELDLEGSGRRWWETTMFPFADARAGRRGAALVSRDVTAREAAARAVAASIEHLRLTLNATGDAIFASDTRSPDEPLLFVNDRMLQMWDIPPEHAAGLTPASVMAAAGRYFVDPARENARVAEIIAGHQIQEDRVTLNDGRVLLRRCIPTTLHGRELRVWSFRDITIEARALAGLRTVEAQQRALLAAFPGYIACLSSEHRFTFANARLAALLGSTPSALVGEPAGLLVPADSPQQLAHRIARVLDGEVLSFERTFPAAGDAPAVHVLVTLARGLDRLAGQMQCYAFGTDITPQKQTEAALLAARDAARRASRAQRAFVDRMSHELRTPLHSVLGFARLLQDDRAVPPAPSQQAHIDRILASGQQMVTLIDGLLAATRVGDEASGDGPAPAAPVPPGPAAPVQAALPAPAAPAAQPAPAIPAPAPGAALPVLYIDDNPVNTLLMAAMFERLPGLVLRCESDPHRGLAQALAAPPALLLVDIQMPGMDGYELLQRLRAAPATRDVPAIAVSANAMPQDVARGRAAGFAEYLTKPLELRQLRLALQGALPGWSAPA
ncbi:MAG TPA: PAS domain-containing protein [Aquabacterium sp.]|nr:PAS domain-containing protein [Aquabacterium sp.]